MLGKRRNTGAKLHRHAVILEALDKLERCKRRAQLVGHRLSGQHSTVEVGGGQAGIFPVILPANNAPAAVRIRVNPWLADFNLASVSPAVLPSHRRRKLGRQGQATEPPECVTEVRSGKNRRHFTGWVFFSWGFILGLP